MPHKPKTEAKARRRKPVLPKKPVKTARKRVSRDLGRRKVKAKAIKQADKSAKPIEVKPSEMLENGQWETFCQKMALGVFSNYSCYMQAYPETSADAARRDASRLLTNADIKARIVWIREEALKHVKHTIEESVQWCKRVIETPVGYIDDESPLAQEVERTITGTEAEGVITKVKVKSPSKMDAQKHLDDLMGFKKIDKDANKTADAIVDLVSWIRNGANMVPKGGTA